VTTTPPWGTPRQHPEPPHAAAADPYPQDRYARGGDDRSYVVLVEQTTGSGESKRWDLVWPPAGPGGRAEARQHAERTAYEFVPQNPYSEQRRAVFRLDEDSYLVRVEGMMSAFHFRVCVAEALPDRQASTER
jgi:hypothetical protein